MMKHENADPSVCSIDVREIIEERLAKSPQSYLAKLSAKESVSEVCDISHLEKLVQSSPEGVLNKLSKEIINIVQIIKESSEKKLNEALQTAQDNLFRENSDFNALNVIVIQAKLIENNVTP